VCICGVSPLGHNIAPAILQVRGPGPCRDARAGNPAAVADESREPLVVTAADIRANGVAGHGYVGIRKCCDQDRKPSHLCAWRLQALVARGR
jgi:hypothetical protein